MITREEFHQYLKDSIYFNNYKTLLSADGKYFEALYFIFTKKPKLTLEYGGGASTFIIGKLLKELNYGGKIIGFEDQKKYYDIHVDNGHNIDNNIIHTPEYKINGKKFTYVHDLEPYKDVDFVILDGPDYRNYGDALGVTDNLELLVNYTGREIPYFMDGRTGCVKYYKELGYTLEQKDLKNREENRWRLKNLSL